MVLAGISRLTTLPAVITEGDTRQYADACANPDVIANSDGQCVFQPLIAAFMVHRMTGGIEADIGRNKDIVAEGDFGAVQDHQIDVGVKVLTDFNVKTVIAVER